MVSSSTKYKSDISHGEIADIQVISQNPEQLIGVRTSRVYSQIARISRDSRMQSEKAILVTVLEQSRIEITMNGKIVKKDPAFIKMTAHDVKKCFGKQVKKLPKESFFKL